MKAEELRIGNLVTIDNPDYWPNLKDVPLKVTNICEAIGFDEEWTYNVGLISLNERENIKAPLYSQFVKYLKPIALTEDLLKRCGFFDWHKNNAGKIYSPIDDDGWVLDYLKIVLRGEEFTFKKREIFLHDLQNIYYALTGKEINIDLKQLNSK